MVCRVHKLDIGNFSFGIIAYYFMTLILFFRMMQDPKPLVVGIAWVVDCVEKRTRVDEAKFLVDLELVNVAGVTKVYPL